MSALRSASLAVLSGCTSASMYYPAPVPPPPGWQAGCADEVSATVIVENTLEVAAEVHELLPDAACAPSLRATVGPGESADVGPANGAIWRAYEAESRAWIATFELVDGENVLVLE